MVSTWCYLLPYQASHLCPICFSTYFIGMLAGINSVANIQILENLHACIFQECALFPLVPTSLACSPESFESGGGEERLLSRFHLKQSPAQPPNPSSLSENCSVISAVMQFGIYHGLLQFATFIFFTQPSQRWRVERWRGDLRYHFDA